MDRGRHTDLSQILLDTTAIPFGLFTVQFIIYEHGQVHVQCA